MLPVIIWSPLQQYGDVVKGKCPKCLVTGTNNELMPTGWTDSSNSDHVHPRLLHCVNTNVLLISRIYTCSSQHLVLGHHLIS